MNDTIYFTFVNAQSIKLYPCAPYFDWSFVSGIIRLYYDVKGGSVRPPDENTVPANPNTDFAFVAGGHITMYDGENSAAITVRLGTTYTCRLFKTLVIHIVILKLLILNMI